MANCSEGYTPLSEFDWHDECDVPEIGVAAVRWLNVAFSALFTLTVAFLWCFRRRHYCHKPPAPRCLLIFIPCGSSIILARSLFGALVPTARVVISLPAAILTHAAGAGITFLIVLFIYVEVKLINESYKGLGGAPLRCVPPLVLIVGMIETSIFALTAFVGYYGSAVISPNVSFWVSALLAICTVGPLICIFGCVIYAKLTNRKAGKRRDKLAKRIIVVVATTTGIIALGGIFALIAISGRVPKGDWLYLELCWAPVIAVYAFIFYLLSHRKTRRRRTRVGSLQETTVKTDTTTTAGAESVATVSPTADTKRAKDREDQPPISQTSVTSSDHESGQSA